MKSKYFEFRIASRGLITLLVYFVLTCFSINGYSQELVLYRDTNMMVGYKDKATGKIMIPAKFTMGEKFVDGLAIVSEDENKPNSNTSFGVINTKGVYISDIKFYKGRNLGKGLIEFSNVASGNVEYGNGKIYFGGSASGIMNSTGKILLPLEYNYIGDISEELIVVGKGDSLGVINTSGVYIVALQTEYRLDGKFEKGVIPIICKKEHDDVGLMDKTGAILIQPCGSNISEIENFNKCGIARVKMNDRMYGLINKSGKFILEPTYPRIGGPFGDSGGSFYNSSSQKFSYNCSGQKL